MTVDVAPYVIDYPDAPISWAGIFGRDCPVELEIGSGKGLFLCNAGAARPGRGFLGVEIARKYAHEAAVRIAKRDLRNVRMLAGDARRFLHLFVPPASVDALHVYFPDPWWKKRHKKRRVFCEPFVVDAAAALKPGGDFHIVTDVEEYHGVIRELMDSRPEFLFHEPPSPTEPEHELDYLTNFERKYRIEGRPIYRSYYRRIDPSSTGLQ